MSDQHIVGNPHPEKQLPPVVVIDVTALLNNEKVREIIRKHAAGELKNLGVTNRGQ